MITSLKNSTIKELEKLKTVKGRKETGLFMVEGPHLVQEAKDARVLEKAYTISKDLEGELVSEDVMKKLASTNTVVPQIGVCRILTKKELSKQILVLDGVQDPGNMGTLLRTAKAFGFNTIFLSEGSVDIYNEKVIRSSQGAIFKLNFIYGNKVSFLKDLENEYQIYSTNVKNGKSVKDIEKKDKIILILGNEGSGVSSDINNLNFQNLYIPMSGMESLNVAVAGAILMYELKEV